MLGGLTLLLLLNIIISILVLQTRVVQKYVCVVAFPFYDGPFESFDKLLISLRFENRERAGSVEWDSARNIISDQF